MDSGQSSFRQCLMIGVEIKIDRGGRKAFLAKRNKIRFGALQAATALRPKHNLGLEFLELAQNLRTLSQKNGIMAATNRTNQEDH